MSRELLTLKSEPIEWSGSDQNSLTKILAVGDLQEWEERGNPLPSGSGIAFLGFHEITHAVLEELAPEYVYSPVLARNFDCIELAILLHNLRYQGTYRALGEGLPKPDLIVGEVRQMCPMLNFEIIVT